MKPGRGLTPRERFERFLEPGVNGCVVFTGGGFGQRDPRQDYGTLKVDGKKIRAHQWAWEQEYGPVPQGRQLHHRCENTRCVNLEHLQLVTRSEHARAHGWLADNRNKTHCPQGHPYDQINTYVDPAGRRHCRACGRRRSQDKRKAPE